MDRVIMSLQGFGLTHTGMKRGHNEDSIFFSDKMGIYLVADGMGGHEKGEIASAMTIEAILEDLKSSDQEKAPFLLKDSIKRANQRIYQYSRESHQSKGDDGTLVIGMGTTIVALYADNGLAHIAHVGDSRAYRMRDSCLALLTKDHSLAAMAADAQKTSHIPINTGFKNIITRAVGMEADVEVDLQEEKLEPSDLFLLCSDGLTNMVSEERIEKILSSGLSLSSTCEALVDEANRNGGKDNISCILIRYC